ncbi:MAG: mechanosensitive ion channel family protein [Candidatus Campbellbacteria bacterium]|nr:mechanosensitive ion channel family protein [Candidatus Campbellbacteria bacterium]
MNLDTVILGNNIEEYLLAVAATIVVYAILWVFKQITFSFLKKRKDKLGGDVGYALFEMASYVKFWFYLAISLYVGTQFLELSARASLVFERVFLVALVAQAIILGSIFLRFLLRQKYAKGKSATIQSAVEILSTVAVALLWILGVLFVLSNFGVEITSLIAGLGVGGLAVALALQGVLGDLFSSLAIYFDKPFEVGDFIEYAGNFGTVKHIGMKTSRIELLSGEEFVVTNRELSDGKIRNFTRLEEYRESMNFGVTYETSLDKLERIPEIVQSIVESIDKARFDRTHLSGFDESALTFTTIYFVEDNNYDVYMDTKQKINLEVLRAFEKEGIEIAYPTRTLHVQKESPYTNSQATDS